MYYMWSKTIVVVKKKKKKTLNEGEYFGGFLSCVLMKFLFVFKNSNYRIS